MEYRFLLENYSFDDLKTHALYLADRVGVDGLFLSFDKPSSEIRKLSNEHGGTPEITVIPNDIGQREMDVGSGLWISATSDKKWRYVASKQEVNGSPYWLVNVEFEESTLESESIIDVFLALIEQIRPDLAFGYSEFGAPYDIRYFSSDLGPWAGLRDLYWLNYYGDRYSRLIGIDRIKNVEQITNLEEIKKGVFFTLDKSLLNNRQEIISRIGNEYFIRESISGGAEQSSGFFQLFKTLYHLSKDSNDAIAKKRPPLD